MSSTEHVCGVKQPYLVERVCTAAASPGVGFPNESEQLVYVKPHRAFLLSPPFLFRTQVQISDNHGLCYPIVAVR